MSQQAFDSYLSELKPGGLLIVDPDMIDNPDERKDVKLLKVPAAKTADALGNRIVTNMIMLGALQEETRVVTVSSLKKSVTESVPSRFIDLNLKAMGEGRRIVESLQNI